MLLQSLLHLSNCSRQVANFFKEDVHSKSSKVSAFFMTSWFVSFIPMTNICWNKCCHALLHVCSGSTLALSINFPRGGSNSCLDFWFAIKVVTFVRAFNSFSESFCCISLQLLLSQCSLKTASAAKLPFCHLSVPPKWPCSCCFHLRR